MSWNLTAIGLLLDMIGFVLVFAFGGFDFGSARLLLESDQSHKTKWIKIVGAILVIFGFGLQLAGAL